MDQATTIDAPAGASSTCRWITLPGDRLTPVGAFLALRGNSTASFLLESVEGGEHLARYSILGLDPSLVLRSRVNLTSASDADGVRDTGAPILQLAAGILKGARDRGDGLPSRFAGGLVGFVGYDEIRTLERIPSRTVDRTGAPDSVLGYFTTFVVFDHLTHRLRIVVSAGPGEPADPPRTADRLSGRLEQIRSLLRGGADAARAEPGAFSAGPLESDLSRFPGAVAAALDHIRAGDIFQVVLSEAASAPYVGDPFQVYRALRMINPSPYHFYMDFGDTILLGSSPEMLVRRDGDRLEHVPIAGTRRRGADARSDAVAAAELCADEKERAEHVMLVDLGRNDLSRVCRPGTVTVERFMDVERYSHVMHLVSRLAGAALPDTDPVEAFSALFPAGTVTGAPKIRAMEIIDDLEGARRGFYGGAAGYFDASGNFDFCLTIRSILAYGGRLHLRAGAGIVAASRPDRETAEIGNKLGALVEAVRIAGSMDG